MAQDKIIQVDAHDQYMENMGNYSIAVLYERFVADIRDGLKPVQRRSLVAMYYNSKAISQATKKKSATTVGSIIGMYHPHGDAAVYGSFPEMVNWWQCKLPLINYDSNSGSLQGGPQASMRYTESYLSKFSMDCIFSELREAESVVDWQTTFDNFTQEPKFLPVKIPLLLINGSFAIAIGKKIEIPKHSVNDVIDTTIALMHNPKAPIKLIPDPCQRCEIIDTDWEKIAKNGFGYYTERGIVEINTAKNGNQYLSIRSTPDYVTANSICEKIEELIKNKILVQITDISDHSSGDEDKGLDIRIMLNKGADANYVKQVLYKHTDLQKTKRVNMEVIVDNEVKSVGYRAYFLYFLEQRRICKFRIYNSRLQTVVTRLHQIETYIKVLESGEVEKIIHMIRTQSADNEYDLITWLMKKLTITDIQAKFILQTPISRLSKGHLNKYKEEQAKLQDAYNEILSFITNPDLINREIEQELLDIRAKYGAPRKSILISEAEASGIPEGAFKIVLTEQNYIKKMGLNDPIKIVKGDMPKFITIADNSKDLLLFDEMGKVFRLPVSKISFTDKNSPGIDIRMLIKKATSNIISVMYLPIIEELSHKRTKNFLVVLTKSGLIKKIDLDDIINSTLSGIIYARLNVMYGNAGVAVSDQVCDIVLANDKHDIIVYSGLKALRFSMMEIPYLKRTAMGNIAMKSTQYVDGMSIVTPDTKEIIVITTKGKFNKLDPTALPRSSRNSAGSRVIKLSKDDSIKNIFTGMGNSILRITRVDEELEINTADIPIGSSISTGVKLCKEGIIKAEIIKS